MKRRGEAMMLAAGGSLPSASQKQDGENKIDRVFPGVAPASKKMKLSPETRPADKMPPLPPSRTASDAATHMTQLPEHLMLLNSIFEAMLSARGLLKRRSEKVTVQTMTPIVQASTSRTFKIQYVQQIKHIYPGAFDWEFVRAPTVQDPTKLELQLLLKYERAVPAASGASGPGRNDSGGSRFNETTERAVFKERLAAWWQEQQAGSLRIADAEAAAAAVEVPCAELPSKDNINTLGVSPCGSRGNSPSMRKVSSGAPPRAPPSSPSMHSGVVQQQAAGGGLQAAPSGSLLSRQPSILDGLAQRVAAKLPADPQAMANTPTSRPKRKMPDSGADNNGAGPSNRPEGGARAAPRRRMALAPVFEGQADSGVSGAVAGGHAGVAGTDAMHLQPALPQPTSQQTGGRSAFAAAEVQSAAPGTPSGSQQQGGSQVSQQPAPSQQGPPGPTASGPQRATSSGGRPRNPLLARFFSAESLQAFDKAAASGPGREAADKVAAERRHAQSLLPQALDLVRSIYGPKGPVVKPRDEVVELMRQKSSMSSGMSSAEASLALELLVAHAPDVVGFETQGGAAMLRLSRGADVVEVRRRLREVAAQVAAAEAEAPAAGVQ